MFDENDVLWNADEPFDRRSAWIDLCQTACWKPRTKLIGGDAVPLERGQLIASERYLAKRWRWHRSKVTRFLNLLVKLQRIELNPNHPANHLGAIITLPKYDTYNRPVMNDRTTSGAKREPGTSQGRAKGEEVEEGRGDKSPLKDRRKNGGPSPEFEQAWLAYPRRLGGNPKKGAYRAWCATLKRGVSPQELIRATEHYGAFVEARGKAGTEYVKQAATFYGPDEPWRDYLDHKQVKSSGSANPWVAPYAPPTEEELSVPAHPLRSLEEFRRQKENQDAA